MPQRVLMRSRSIRLAWGLCALLFALPVLAQRVEGDRASAEGLYAAEVPVSSQSEAQRNSGIARALAQVLGKISGDEGAARRPGVGKELRRANEFVEGYDYRQTKAAPQAARPAIARCWWCASARTMSRIAAASACRCGRSRGPSGAVARLDDARGRAWSR